MKIRRVTSEKGYLSNICQEGSDAQKTHRIRAGSGMCHSCPLFWFRIGNLVFCRGKIKVNSKIMIKVDYGARINEFIEKCDELIVICGCPQLLGFNGKNPFIESRKLAVDKELSDLEDAIENMRHHIYSGNGARNKNG